MGWNMPLDFIYFHIQYLKSIIFQICFFKIKRDIFIFNALKTPNFLNKIAREILYLYQWFSNQECGLLQGHSEFSR